MVYVLCYVFYTSSFLMLCVGVYNRLLTPMAEDEYAWNGDKATFVVNLLSAVNSFISIATFMGTRYILKW